MKKLLVVIAFSLLPSLCLASVTSLGFRAYSTPTAKSCSVMGGHFINGAFQPELANAAIVSLGNKGYGTFTPGANDEYVKVFCYPTSGGPTNAYTVTKTGTETTAFTSYTSLGGFRTGTNTVATTQTFGSSLGTFVKMYFNGSETFSYPITETFLKVR